MKRLLGLMVAVVVATGCGPEIDLAARPKFDSGNNFWTLFIYDGLTGAAIDDAAVTLIVGTYTYDVKNQGGYYSIGQLPPGEHVATIEAPGYLTFVGAPEFWGSGSDPTFITNTVLLYSDRGVDADVTVRVYENVQGTPVASGTVIATMSEEGSLFGELDNDLNGDYYLRPSAIVASIGADGSATLPKAQLVLGATYEINVLSAVNQAQAYLQPTDPDNPEEITIGIDFPEVTIFMGAPALTPEALSTNTEGPDSWDYNNDFNYDGYFDSLVINFPYPVEQCSQDDDHWWSLNNNGWVGDGEWDDYDCDTANGCYFDDIEQPYPLADDAIDVTFTNEGRTVTLTPNFGLSADDGTPATPVSTKVAQDGIAVYLTGVELRVVGSSECVDFEDIWVRDQFPVVPLLQISEVDEAP